MNVQAPKMKKMPFRKGFLHGTNEKKLRNIFNWTED